MLNLYTHTHGPVSDHIFFRRVLNLGNVAGGNSISTALNLAVVLPIDPAGAFSLIVQAPDGLTVKPLSAVIPALPDLLTDSSGALASGFASDSQWLSHAAPSPSSDVTLLPLPFSEEVQMSGANGI
jgi:hypothetical protein